MGSFKELEIEKIAQLERQLENEERDLASFQSRLSDQYHKSAGMDSLMDFVMAQKKPAQRLKLRRVKMGGSLR